MARPLRIEYPGALYHITARGVRRAAIYGNDVDRIEWLDILAQVCNRFNFTIPAYCEMGNHYHLLLETPDGNLCQGMRQLNSIYSQYFNRRHEQTGHVFQGRYKAILVQRETYLLALARYIVLNPVRAKCSATAGDWPWSSYRATVGMAAAPAWLNVNYLLGRFGSTRIAACAAYKRFVEAGMNAANPLNETRHQLVLGDQGFVEHHRHPRSPAELSAISREQRRLGAASLDHYAARYADRDQAMAAAYFSTAYTMAQISQYFRVSSQTVSRAVKRYESE